jgi:ABC-type bacteriocin/lantibiotic exporter with double-glycine peptidase domain
VLYATFTKIQGGILSSGDFIMVEGYLIALLIPLRELFTEIRAIVDTRIDLEPMQRLFKSPTEKRHTAPSLTDSEVLQVLRVSFGYPARHDVIKDFSLTLKKKDRLLIMGQNGAGKTTLCHLILGLLPPTQGQILWRGEPVHRIPFDVLAKDMMYVSGQHPFLDQTVEMHMTFGQEIKQIDIQDALRKVGLFVSIDTKVKELSLGERQRILLARALFVKPKILILDEALFMVDAKSQTMILEQFDACIDILIVVSHQQQHVLTFTHQVDMSTVPS